MKKISHFRYVAALAAALAALPALGLAAQESAAQGSAPLALRTEGGNQGMKTAGAKAGPDWELSAWPNFLLPLASENDSMSVNVGGGLALSVRPASARFFTLGVEGTYAYGFLKDSFGNDLGTSLSEAGLGLSASAEKSLGDYLAARAFLRGGLLMGRLTAGESPSAYYGRAESGIGMDIKPAPDWKIFADLSWEEHFGLYGALSVRAGTRWLLQTAAAKNGPRIRFGDFETDNLFPVLYSWYDDHAFGEITITNQGRETIKNVRADLSLKPYADQSKECLSITSLKPGETAAVSLNSLLNPEVLNLTETTKASIVFTVSYDDSKGAHSESRSGTVQFMDRNAITWDDDRKVAAFVSGKDPWVMDISNNLNTLVKDLRAQGLNKNLETALAVHLGLQAWGISYVHSPESPFSQSFANPEVVDYLKFPRQTLNYRAGDCADLSVLYASFFESLGIGTAFITVPGHIFMAIDLGLDPATAKESTSLGPDLVVAGGKTWLPIETTLRDGTLAEAVRQAANQWQAESATGNAALYDLHEAWQTFPPVGLDDDGTRPGTLAFAKDLQATYSGEQRDFLDREILFRMGDIGERIKADPKNAKLYNTRGVTYARFGQYDDAAKDFAQAVKLGYVPAMVNMGNLSLAKKKYAEAKDWFSKAQTLDPNNQSIAKALAKADQNLGTGGAVASSGTAVGQRGASQEETATDWQE